MKRCSFLLALAFGAASGDATGQTLFFRHFENADEAVVTMTSHCDGDVLVAELRVFDQTPATDGEPWIRLESMSQNGQPVDLSLMPSDPFAHVRTLDGVLPLCLTRPAFRLVSHNIESRRQYTWVTVDGQGAPVVLIDPPQPIASDFRPGR